MKWPGAMALLGACGGGSLPATPGMSVVLDVPAGPLAPKGVTSVEVILHEPAGDVTRKAAVAADGSFDLGSIDPSTSGWVEATLRDDRGGAVGYGRTAAVAEFAGGNEIVVPVRRPIVYFAGTVSSQISDTGFMWTEAPATFLDLSAGTALDGTTQLASPTVMTIAAGPNLYVVTQVTSDPAGVLVGPATLVPVSTDDHQIAGASLGQVTGAVIDGAGSDDGRALVIGTSTKLFAVDTASGAVSSLADGRFDRVAVLTTDGGEIDAVAIKNRGLTTENCAASAELWWVRVSGGAHTAAHLVATGGFSDVAADHGHAYYADACTGVLGEVTATAAAPLRTLGGTPAVLAVSNGQAYVGVETPPATTSLVVAPITTTGDTPRTLWSETAQQISTAYGFPGVQRQLDATSAVLGHLEIGAGGDYIALTTRARFHGGVVWDVGFPEMTVETDELRVFAAASGGIVQRYRSWCAGAVFLDPQSNEISDWDCAATPGQTAAATVNLEHYINSMTFLFGKR